MSDLDMFDDLDSEVSELESSFGGAVGMAAQFDTELKRINQTFGATAQSAGKLDKSLSRTVAKAIDGVVLDGMKLSDTLGMVRDSMIDAAWKAAVQPVSNHLGGMLATGMNSLFGAFTPFADGGAFSQGRVTPFANGGVVNGPVTFPMRGGMGLMGEAGPEAIMPLSRGPDGKLGVRTQGGGRGPFNIVMNIQTPDVKGFQRSQSQIAANMSRMLGAGARNR